MSCSNSKITGRGSSVANNTNNFRQNITRGVFVRLHDGIRDISRCFSKQPTECVCEMLIGLCKKRTKLGKIGFLRSAVN